MRAAAASSAAAAQGDRKGEITLAKSVASALARHLRTWEGQAFVWPRQHINVCYPVAKIRAVGASKDDKCGIEEWPVPNKCSHIPCLDMHKLVQLEVRQLIATPGAVP